MAGFQDWLLHWLNDWVAQSPANFHQALAWVEQNAWIWVAVVLTAFWFWGEPGAFPSTTGKITRLESRRKLILTLGALGVAFLLTRLLQNGVFHPRPLVDTPLQIPIEPDKWHAIRTNLAMRSGFPGFLAVTLFGVTTTLFSFNRWVGFAAVLASSYFCALQIGLGFYWPIDILAGALLGVLVITLALFSQPLWSWFLNPVVLLFEARQALAYPAGFLVMFELSQKFAGVLTVVKWVWQHAAQF